MRAGAEALPLLACASFCAARCQRLPHDLGHLRHLVDAHESVHFGQQLGQFLPKPLRQAAGYNQALAAVVGLAHLSRFEDGIHALLLGGIDEGAGIDDHGVGLVRIVGDLHAVFE